MGALLLWWQPVNSAGKRADGPYAEPQPVEWNFDDRHHRRLGDAMAMSSQHLAYPLNDALYLNLTNSCTLACVFCPKVSENDLTMGGLNLRLRGNPTADEVWAAACAAGLQGRSEVVFTGFGEPTIRFSVLVELIERLKQVSRLRVRLDTDGLASLRERRDVVPELSSAGLDAVSVSLNAPDAVTYSRVCPNRYGENAWPAVCEFIRSARAHLPETVASFVALPELSQDECRGVAEALGAVFRWRSYKTTSMTR